MVSKYLLPPPHPPHYPFQAPPHVMSVQHDLTKARPSLLWGRLGLRMVGAAPDGVWPFPSPHNRLLKATLDEGQGGPRWLEGPRLSFLFPSEKTLCLGVSAVLL